MQALDRSTSVTLDLEQKLTFSEVCNPMAAELGEEIVSCVQQLAEKKWTVTTRTKSASDQLLRKRPRVGDTRIDCTPSRQSRTLCNGHVCTIRDAGRTHCHSIVYVRPCIRNTTGALATTP